MVAPPFVIGHRGAAAWAPENTLASIRAAASLGVRWVEFDVRLSRDGCPVLFHDDDLDRTTDGAGPVAGRDLDDLLTLDAGGWFAPAFRGEPIPTLEAAIATLADLGLGANIEIKPDAPRAEETATTVAEVVRTRWPPTLPPPLFSSFHPGALAALRRAEPRAELALLVSDVPADWRRRLHDLGCGALHCAARRLRRDQAAAVVAEGVPLRCYTVNRLGSARKLAGWGVGSVFTDDPRALLPREASYAPGSSVSRYHSRD